VELAGLTFKEMMDILKNNGYSVATDLFWDKHNRIILKKGGESVILQFDTFYCFPFVYKFLTSLEIEVPEHCKIPYGQYLAQLNSNNPKNN